MTEVVVRPAEAEDAEGFTRAYEASWDATIGVIVGRPLQELAPFEKRVEGARTSFAQFPAGAGAWVAEASGEIVGVAVRVGSELRSLYVVPDAWGTGAGQSFVAPPLAPPRPEAHAEATLWVVAANPRARRFYEREGWEPTGETRDSELGPPELQYRLQLSR
jgi:GNAT superfamily N-acetyltransferase